MDWTPIIVSAIGGGVVVKILDIVWLQKVLAKRDHNAWLRENRLEAFTNLAAELLQYGTGKPEDWNVLEARGRVARALLLADDDKLFTRVVDVLNNISILSETADSIKSSEQDEHTKAQRAAGLSAVNEIIDEVPLLIEVLRKQIADN